MGGRPVRQNGEGHQDYTQEDNQRNLEYEGPQPQVLYTQIVQDFLLMGFSWTRQHIVCLLPCDFFSFTTM